MVYVVMLDFFSETPSEILGVTTNRDRAEAIRSGHMKDCPYFSIYDYRIEEHLIEGEEDT